METSCHFQIIFSFVDLVRVRNSILVRIMWEKDRANSYNKVGTMWSANNPQTSVCVCVCDGCHVNTDSHHVKFAMNCCRLLHTAVCVKMCNLYIHIHTFTYLHSWNERNMMKKHILFIKLFITLNLTHAHIMEFTFVILTVIYLIYIYLKMWSNYMRQDCFAFIKFKNCI